EAIFILGRARSFRTSSIKKVIQFGTDYLTVSGKVQHNSGDHLNIGIRSDGKICEIKIGTLGAKSKTDLAYAFPLQLIHPKSYKLLDEGPQIRREFLDWGVFNLYDEYLPIWRKFRKSLIQRNMLLKQRQTNQLNVWDVEFARFGEMVAEYRREYLGLLKSHFIEVTSQFLNCLQLDLRISDGWDVSSQLIRVLQKDRDKDLRYGFTRSGPQCGDFQIMIDNRQAKDFVSRGQQKLMVLALNLAQIKLMRSNYSRIGCILIDDLTSELDEFSKGKLIEFLADIKMQIFMTATGREDFGNLDRFDEYKLFHVEQGCIEQV
ncbi:MAG: DNA replication/repair protein RecF, partial [Gammaproteobacteria bacterium]